MSGEAAPAAPAPAAAAAAAAAAETPAESTPRNGFTKEQLKQILPELAAALRDLIKVTPEKFNLCGTNEQKIDRVIENEQRRVLVKLGFDAEIGMANLRRVARDYKNDKEIMRPFGAMVQFEELTTTLVIARNGGKKPSPQQVAKMMQNIQQLSGPEQSSSSSSSSSSSAASSSSSSSSAATTGAAASPASTPDNGNKPSANKMEK